MADLVVKPALTGDTSTPVVAATENPNPPAALPPVAAAGDASHYDGVRGARKASLPPKLQLQTPGVGGSSKPACDDLPGSWCAIY